MLATAASSGSSLRHSRRSACDRCRTNKLRCQRDERPGRPCERCAKAHLACTTTFQPTPTPTPTPTTTPSVNMPPPSLSAVTSPPRRKTPENGTRHPPLCSSLARPASPPSNPTADAVLEQHHVAEEPMSGSDDNWRGNVVDPMDFSMADMAFETTDDLALLIADLPAHGASTGVFGQEGGGSSLNGSEWPSRAEHELQRLAGMAAHKDLLTLSLELVEDRDILETLAPLTPRPSIVPLTCSSSTQQQPINRILKQTAKFRDIIKCLSVPADQSSDGAGSSHGSGSRSDSTGSIHLGWDNIAANGNGESCWSASPRPVLAPQDHLLMVNLVTTYVNLLRNCSAIFVRLYQGLQVTPPVGSNAKVHLPSLQFGEFQLGDSVTIQAKVLVELISGMLLRIGSTLGISKAGASSPSDDGSLRLALLDDPIAVSIREIILTQESMQGGVYGGLPSLDELTSDLKRLLEGKES
ncbi:hypothetical protein B0H67DRAFT_583356 [Lasiosphaeris hirsuta]|uniref:Zn(2)-C6 fungal-type domain-containing protein n=1 Tax=Lasiosphaeris hirsuta TaxID=260670 RepID=A0AA40A7J6_9PEZI|nr:hypothetical protein B0H67DRAFT_583356 [Lasiosphaeris hirsuta]